MPLLRGLFSVAAYRQLPRDLRRVVFYSEGRAYWPHLSGLLEAFLDASHTCACYVTSAVDDPGLTYRHPNLRSFLIDDGWVRNWFFENLDADVMVMTMPDLDQFQIKRSSYPVHYVYVQHSLVSCHMAYRRGAFDSFDTVFCAGPHHVRELRAMERYYGTPGKNLVEHGYHRLDTLIADNVPNQETEVIRVLVAPSWGRDCLIETVGTVAIENLVDSGFEVTLRPHPQTLRTARRRVREIERRFRGHSRFRIDLDVAGHRALAQSDVMISDWSGAALDYAFGLEKPVVFVDVSRKVNNPDYEAIQIEPFEVTIRAEVGTVVSIDKLGSLAQTIRDLLRSNQRLASFKELRNVHVFNVGNSSRVGADALISLSNARREASQCCG